MKKRVISFILALAIVCSLLPGTAIGAAAAETDYTFDTYATTLATDWNPHTWTSSADSTVLDLLTTPLVDMTVADSENGIYQWVYLAAQSVTDVTAQHQDDLVKYGASATDATSGYIFDIALNPDMKWQDGTAINADTYIYSMERLLNPGLQNYRANNYYSGEAAIAGAEGYFYAGQDAIHENYNTWAFTGLSDLVLGEDGVYTTPAGGRVYIPTTESLAYLGGSLGEYVDAYGSDYFDVDAYNSLVVLADENGNVTLTEESTALLVATISTPNWGEDESYLPNYIKYVVTYPEVGFDTVGLYKVDDYTIRYVTQNYLDINYLLTSLTSNWLVYESLYETGSYGNAVSNTMSYGPYKLSSVTETQMVLTQNENHYEYTVNSDGSLSSVTEFLVDGKQVNQWQTQNYVIHVMDSATAKAAFLAGQLDEWTPSSNNLVAYSASDRLYKADESYTMSLFFNSNLEALQAMDNAAVYDNANSVVLSNDTFREAFSLAIDRSDWVTATSGYKPAVGLMNNLYFYDIYNNPNSSYRYSEQAMAAMCDLYGVSYTADTLKEAYNSITGHDLAQAKALMAQACDELVEAGLYAEGEDIFINVGWTSRDLTAVHRAQVAKLTAYLNAAAEGSGFGTITLNPVDNTNCYSAVPEGQLAIGYGAWGGGAFYPFQLLRVYLDPGYVMLNEGACWDPATEELTLTVGGEEVTMTWQNWSQACTSGAYRSADFDTKLTITAALEAGFLGKYYRIPLAGSTSCSMLSYQLDYYTQDYNTMYGFGGLRLMTYNYSDAEWEEYVASGELDYGAAELPTDATEDTTVATEPATEPTTDATEETDPAIVNSGSCGENVTWTLDENGLLTISGTGSMYDYGEEPSPFYDSEDILYLVIEDGVTTIGDRAFECCWELESVSIPNTVTTIGRRAFGDCCDLQEVTIPASVTTLRPWVFSCCDNLRKIVFEGDTPAVEGDYIFKNLHYSACAYYPAGNPTWTEAVMDSYGEGVAWIAYQYDVDEIVFAGTSLSLNGDIGVNFYVDLAEELLADENLRMVFNVGEQTWEVALADALTSVQNDGSVWYRFSCSMAAKEMTDRITVQMYGTYGALGKTKSYGVASYYYDICEQFDREEKAELFAMIEAMLNYGAAAQEYFDYNTDYLANVDVSTAVPETVDASAYAAVVSNNDENLSYAGMSLVLESNTVLRVFFRPTAGADISGYTFTANGQTVTPVQRGNLWYIELANIAAKDLDTAYTFTAGDVTVQGSALSYVNSVLNKADALDEKLVAVCKALYAYNEAANAYFQTDDCITVNYYCSASGTHLNVLQEQIDQWNAVEGAASGVNIQLISGFSWDLETLMNDGTHYDIIEPGAGWEQWKLNGWVQDLNAIEDEELQALIASFEQYFTPGINTDPGPDGEYFLHSLPYDAVPLKMAVNLDLFEQAGVALPETWEDVVAAAEAISNLGDDIYGYGGTNWSVYYTRLHMLTAGNSLHPYWDPNTETYSFSQYEEIVMALKTMFENGWLGGLDDMSIDPIRAEFAAGNIGMFPSPSYDFAVYTAQYPAECNWAVIDMPAASNGGDYKGLYIDRVGCSIDAVAYADADDAKKDAIVKAFCFLNSNELASVLYANGCIIPYKYEVIANTEILVDPQWAQYADIENYMSVPQVPDSILSLEGDRIHDVINAIVHGALDWDTAIADAEARYNAAYQAAKENPDIDTSIYAYEYNH